VKLANFTPGLIRLAAQRNRLRLLKSDRSAIALYEVRAVAALIFSDLILCYRRGTLSHAECAAIAIASSKVN
jgi:hypothetical protein